MPAVIFLACLFIPFFPAGDLDQKSSFLDGYYLMVSISDGEANRLIFHRWFPVFFLGALATNSYGLKKDCPCNGYLGKHLGLSCN
jgi:hypothetical protein